MRFPLILSVALVLSCLSLDSSAKEKASKNKKSDATIELTVSPRMSCQNCEKKIKSNLRFEKGVSNIATSLKDQKVTLTYNPSKTDSAKIVQAFKKIGYSATPYPRKP